MAVRLGRLVDVTTVDGVKLHGFASETKTRSEIAWLFLHGVNSNFYSSTLISELCDAVSAQGFATLAANTRGHDIVTFNTGPVPRKLGSQYELVEHSTKDIDAWMRYLLQDGFSSVILVGHSLGAVKSTYWLAGSPTEANPSDQRSRIKGFIALSPPRLNTDHLLNDPERGPVFQQHLKDAQEFCDDNRHDHVMKVRFPMPMWICASTYLDKYGSGARFDIVALVEHLKHPTLWMFGQNEVERGASNFRNVDATLRATIENLPPDRKGPHSISVIANGDHSYHGVRDAVSERWNAWLETQLKIPLH